jgi:hypothetical protein
MDIKNSYYPLLTHNFLNYFVNDTLNDKILLEIGSGDSTLFWENHFSKVISYEDDHTFFIKLSNIVGTNKTELYFFDHKIFEDMTFLKNVQRADYIIIDNNPNNIDRTFFCEFVKKYKKDSSSIILDNGTWNLNAYNCLLQDFFCKDFPGTNKKNELTVTTIFDTKRDLKYFNYTII